MNAIETRLVELLTDLRLNHAASAFRVEFEPSALRLETAIRFKAISVASGLPLTVKLESPEALADIFHAGVVEAKTVMAPSVETSFALSKFVGAVTKVLPARQLEDVQLYAYIETGTGLENLSSMLEAPACTEIDGFVIGRGDLMLSLKKPRSEINSDEILALCMDAARKAKSYGKAMVLTGGGIDEKTMPFLSGFPPGHLDKYQTVHVIFDCPAGLENGADVFRKTTEVEYLWLTNKLALRRSLHLDEDARLDRLRARAGSLVV